jgi:UPF0755 protein
MRRAGMIATLVIGLLALVCGFGGATAALMLTQPSASAHVAVQFTVNQGDTVDAVAARLQAAGLIRSALAFRVLAKVHRAVFQAGTYTLYPDMTMDAIIATLENGVPVKQVSILVPPGLRVTQYPAVFKQLASFNATDFLSIAKTGKFLDGTAVNAQFWFVEPLQPHAYYALEGYLTPQTYEFNSTDTAEDVIKRLLSYFGEQLCPGPDAAHADEYLSSETQCVVHAVKIGGKGIFTLLETNYFTKDPRLALYDALTIASIVQREVSRSVPDIQGVADVLYNRYLVNLNKYPNPPANSPGSLGADPTTQYARDTDHPPANNNWWAPLGNNAATIDPNNLYNTNNPAHVGLPPGPISAPAWTHHMPDAINVGTSQYFYYWASCQASTNVIHYATTIDQATQLQGQFPPTTC